MRLHIVEFRNAHQRRLSILYLQGHIHAAWWLF